MIQKKKTSTNRIANIANKSDQKQLFPVVFEFVYSPIILKKENDCKIE